MPLISDAKNFLRKHWFFVTIVIYLFSRIINLMSLPIFNDEAIWIDWGNKLRLGLIPLFYSLYDGKPPFHFVMISIFMIFIKNPLLAGRLLSVFAGTFSLIAIKKIATLYFEEKYVFISCLIYVISPMFLFYDRQALQEALLTAEISWIIYFSIKYFESLKLKYALYLSLILALTFYTKVSVLILFFPILMLFILKYLKKKDQRNLIFSGMSVIIFVFIFAVAPLLLQNQSNLIFTRNDRYAISLSELNAGLFRIWISNIIKISEVLFWYFNSFMLFIVFTLIEIYRKTFKNTLYILLYFTLPLIILVFISKGLLERYIVPYTIPLIFLSAKGIEFLFKKYKISVLLILLPIAISFFQIIFIDNYLHTMNVYAKGLDLHGYTEGFTSGYGVGEAIVYIKSLEKTHNKIFLGLRVDAGNPESAIMAYFLQDENSKVVPIYFDSKFTKLPLEDNFVGNYYPFYFISRDDNLAGMNDYLLEENRFYQPGGNSFVGVYKYLKL